MSPKEKNKLFSCNSKTNFNLYHLRNISIVRIFFWYQNLVLKLKTRDRPEKKIYFRFCNNQYTRQKNKYGLSKNNS